jgi:hypothetical protein
VYELTTKVESFGELQAERGAGVALKLETSQRLGKVNIFAQCQRLESAPEHFRMQQCLQRAFRLLTFNDCRELGNDPGEEMMLVCKAGKAKPVRLPTLRDVGPIDMRGEVGLTDLFEG